MNTCTMTDEELKEYTLHKINRNEAGRFDDATWTYVAHAPDNDYTAEADLILIENDWGGYSYPAHALTHADEVIACWNRVKDYIGGEFMLAGHDHSPEAWAALDRIHNIEHAEQLKEAERKREAKRRAAAAREHSFSGMHHAFAGLNINL